MGFVQCHTASSGGSRSTSQVFLSILAHAEAQQVEEDPEIEMALNLGIPPRNVWKARVARDELG